MNLELNLLECRKTVQTVSVRDTQLPLYTDRNELHLKIYSWKTLQRRDNDFFFFSIILLLLCFRLRQQHMRTLYTQISGE